MSFAFRPYQGKFRHNCFHICRLTCSVWGHEVWACYAGVTQASSKCLNDRAEQLGMISRGLGEIQNAQFSKSCGRNLGKPSVKLTVIKKCTCLDAEGPGNGLCSPILTCLLLALTAFMGLHLPVFFPPQWALWLGQKVQLYPLWNASQISARVQLAPAPTPSTLQMTTSSMARKSKFQAFEVSMIPAGMQERLSLSDIMYFPGTVQMPPLGKWEIIWTSQWKAFFNFSVSTTLT